MAEERNYYCICDDNCKFPTMTYEQILEAIAEATGNTPEHVEDAFITKIKESNKNANLTFWKGTQAEFNALGVTAPVFKIGIDANGKLYFTPYSADDLTAHASRHASGGEDELTAENIGALPDYGGTMGGNIDMDGHKVTGLPTPTNNSDAATKQYADEIGAGQKFTIVGFQAIEDFEEIISKESLGNKTYIEVEFTKPISLKKGNAIRFGLFFEGGFDWTSTSASTIVGAQLYDGDGNGIGSAVTLNRTNELDDTEHIYFAAQETLSFRGGEFAHRYIDQFGYEKGERTDTELGLFTSTASGTKKPLGYYLGSDTTLSKIRFNFSHINTTRNVRCNYLYAEIEIT